jgi:hypothetical protein
MSPTPRGIRIDPATWDGALAALRTLSEPQHLTITIQPGMTRTDAITSLLRAITELPPTL